MDGNAPSVKLDQFSEPLDISANSGRGEFFNSIATSARIASVDWRAVKVDPSCQRIS